MYTSGSTGKPKGVVVPHRAIARLVIGADYAKFGPDEVLLQMASYAFDASTLEIWGALLNGGRLAIMRPGPATLQEIAETISNERVTTAWLTAGLFNSFISSLPEGLKPLKQLITGGDVLSISHVKQALTLLPDTTIINGYGPTEGTTFSCCRTIDRSDVERSSILIGHPISNSTAYVLDDHLLLAPIGVVGELFIGGDGVALGYFNAPEATSEKFLANPFTESTGDRLYRSGDLCRRLPSGLIEFCGRKDEQVKLRGYRVELGEIESALTFFDEIKNAVVLAKSIDDSDKQLVAYLVLASKSESADISLIRSRLQKILPSYCVPSRFVIVEDIPLTANGKPDRVRLAQLNGKALDGKTESIAYRDDVETKLAAIWNSLLPGEKVGLHDNFWDIGGHSLLAVRMFVDIEKEFGKRLPLPVLFKAQTVAELAEVIRGPLPENAWRSLVPIQTTGKRPPLYCIHPIGGAVTCYRLVAGYIGSDQPVYGLQSRGLDGIQEPVHTVEQMAANYVEEIIASNPDGPYLICGYSFGGVVAHEAAIQLRQMGRQIEFVGLIDTSFPEYSRLELLSSKGKSFWSYAAHQLQIFRRLNGADRRTFFARKMRDALRRLRNQTDDYNQMDDLVAYPTELIKTITMANEQALTRYYPKKYPGELVVFRTSERLDLDFDDPMSAWKTVADKIVVHDLPGNHFTTIKEPNVQSLACELRSCIDRVVQHD
jgi:thioesterase domain-containing protein/acyl carrier protein